MDLEDDTRPDPPTTSSSADARDRQVEHFRRWLGLVAAGALLLRLAYLVIHRDRPVLVDGWVYLLESDQLSETGVIRDPFSGDVTARHPPGWIVFLALARIAGANTIFQLQIAAAVVGAAAVGLVGIVATRITSQRGALVAAGLAAVYPGFWYYERELLSESLAILAAVALIGTAYRFVDRPSARWAFAMGAACATLALVRSEQILLTVIMIAPLVLLGIPGALRRRIALLGVAAIATVAVIAPWFVYNLGRFESPVLLTTGLGTAMAQGSCPVVYEGPLLGFHDIRCDVQATIGHDTGSLDETELDRERRDFAVEHTLDNLDRLPVVLTARQGRTWGFYRPFQTNDLEAGWAGSPVWVLHATTVSFWVLSVAAVLGVLALRRTWQLLLPLLAPCVVVALTVSITFGQPRYRAPADVGIILLSAVGLEAWMRRRAHLGLPTAPGERGTVADPSDAPRPPRPLTEIR